MNPPEAENVRKNNRQAKLIAAMLQQPNLDKAAAAIGMSLSTAYRIRQTLEFQLEYQQAIRDIQAQATVRLRQTNDVAATVILKLMVDPTVPPAVRLRAANMVMEHPRRSKSESPGLPQQLEVVFCEPKPQPE